MSLSVEIGLLLALGTAFGSVAGFLYKFRGAREAPDVDLRRPISSSIALFRSPLYALGILIALGSWGLARRRAVPGPDLARADGDRRRPGAAHGGGRPAVRDRRDPARVDRRGASRPRDWRSWPPPSATRPTGRTRTMPPRRWPSYAGALGLAGLALAALSRRAMALAVSAGLLWAASDTSIKALSSHLGHLGFGVLVHPLAFVILVASLLGLLVSARSLQLGDAVPVIALTSAAANLATIAAGPIVFGEALPSGHLELVVRLLAFALVIFAAALTPPPAAAARGAGRPPAAIARRQPRLSFADVRPQTPPPLRHADDVGDHDRDRRSPSSSGRSPRAAGRSRAGSSLGVLFMARRRGTAVRAAPERRVVTGD